MNKKNLTLLIVLIILIFSIITTINFIFSSFESSDNLSNLTVLGKEEFGSVELLGPYGNNSSDITLAYVIGLHPQENRIHSNFFKTFVNNSDSLEYKYYIYRINVTKNSEDYSQGRMNGQVLAQKYVVNDASSKDYNLVVDIHSNQGNWDENQFMFSPSPNGESEKIAKELCDICTFSTYYVPPNPTSPEYLTLPLINSGTPAIFYEEFVENSDKLMQEHSLKLINAVDSLVFKKL